MVLTHQKQEITCEKIEVHLNKHDTAPYQKKTILGSDQAKSVKFFSIKPKVLLPKFD